MIPAQIDHAMQTAVRHHQAGRLADADAIYRQVLAAQPNHADALHFLGLLARRAGHLVDSANLIGRAIVVNPNQPEFHSNLGVTLMQAGQFDIAIKAFTRATQLRPDYAEAFANLGAALKDRGRLEEAATAFHRAIAIRNDIGEAHLNLGHTLREQGKVSEAIAEYRHAVKLCHGVVEAQSCLGNALAQEGAIAEATTIYRRALELEPANANLLNNLGNVLIAQRQVDEGIAQYRKAIAADPSLVMPYSNLANALRQIDQHDEAIGHLRRAIELKPDFAAAYNNLGNLLKDLGHITEGIAAMRISIELDPTSVDMHSNLVYAVCFDPACGAREHRTEARAWSDRHEKPRERERSAHSNERSPNRKLRIGYVSPDFRNHVVGRNVLPIIERHDREQFEVHCFMTAPVADELTARFKAAADRWHDVSTLDEVSLAKLIRDQQIDIAVDLSLHMAGNRMTTFARKPAPVQVTWAGYPGTTGLNAIDYRITDPYLDPPGSGDEFYSEQSVRLPHSFWCYRSAEDSPLVNRLAALTTGFISFGCLNNFAKVSSAALALWTDVLRRVPDSRLRMMTPRGRLAEELCARFSAGGITADRLVFVTRTTPADYLKLYHDIDICLDPIPYTGHTTSLDALWMGVPVVTLAGNSAVARGGITPLSNLGLTEWIAHTKEEFGQIAAKLAADVEALSQLRSQLRDRMRASPLCNEQQFTADLEAAYRGMWESWCGTNLAEPASAGLSGAR